MFNSSFYPSTPEVIDLMLGPYIYKFTDQYKRERVSLSQFGGNRQILEPSAGKGDIVDRLTEHYTIPKQNTHCIEKDIELSYILQSKGYRVIDNDFLSYDGYLHFDIIIMNPPFDNGAKHLLKAWQILKSGDIICLLNAETIKNLYSKERQLLRNIIDDNDGVVEFIGQPFLYAERPTNVECCIVRLSKEQKESFENIDGIETDHHIIDEQFVANPLAHNDMIQAIVDQYNKVIQLHLEINRLGKEYNFYLQGVKDKSDKSTRNINDELEEIKSWFWRYLFERTKLGKETTSNFREKIESFKAGMQNMSFNKNNIMLMFDIFMQTREQIMQECVEETFKKATSYDKKNKIHVEGWHTNSNYKVNKKIIYPYGVRIVWNGFDTDYHGVDFLRDLDKCLCWLTGKRIENVRTIEDTLLDRFKELRNGGEYRDPIYSEFFMIRFYQKGTVHLTFLSDDIWMDFNIAANKNRLSDGD